jgi:hypothetical protein
MKLKQRSHQVLKLLNNFAETLGFHYLIFSLLSLLSIQKFVSLEFGQIFIEMQQTT